jgi:hypothetical protein
MPTHWLAMTEDDAFVKFQETYPLETITLSIFKRYKPWYVRRVVKNYTCICIYCKVARDALSALQTARRTFHAQCPCQCRYCLDDKMYPDPPPSKHLCISTTL